MTTKRFNGLTILNCNKDLTDKLDLMETGNEFISKNDERFHQFGRFTKEEFNQVFSLFRVKPFLMQIYFCVDKMFCAENLTSFTGNVMSFFFQEGSAVLANLGVQNFKILYVASDPTMVDPPTSQIIWPPISNALSTALFQEENLLLTNFQRALQEAQNVAKIFSHI